MHKFLIPIVACLALSACANLEHAWTEPRVSVYKYVGSVQCKGGGMPLATMMRQLSDAGIPALNVSCGRDGKIYPAVCGAADGHIGVLEVPEVKVSAAQSLGFRQLSDLPEATKVACP